MDREIASQHISFWITTILHAFCSLNLMAIVSFNIKTAGAEETLFLLLFSYQFRIILVRPDWNREKSKKYILFIKLDPALQF